MLNSRNNLVLNAPRMTNPVTNYHYQQNNPN